MVRGLRKLDKSYAGVGDVELTHRGLMMHTIRVAHLRASHLIHSTIAFLIFCLALGWNGAYAQVRPRAAALPQVNVTPDGTPISQPANTTFSVTWSDILPQPLL